MLTFSIRRKELAIYCPIEKRRVIYLTCLECEDKECKNDLLEDDVLCSTDEQLYPAIEGINHENNN